MAKQKLYEKIWAKLLAFFLCCLCILSICGCCAAIIKCADEGLYTYTGDEDALSYAESELCRIQVGNSLIQLADMLTYETPEQLNGWSPSPAFTYILYDADGRVLADTTNADSHLVYAGYETQGLPAFPADNEDTSPSVDAADSETAPEMSDSEAQSLYRIDAYVQIPVPADSSYSPSYKLFTFLQDNCRAFIWFGVLSILAVIVLFTFLMCAAGRVPGEPKPALRGLNKIPLDLYLALTALAGYLTFYSTSYYFFDSYIAQWAAAVINLMVCAPLFLGLCITLAARMKAGRIWKNTVIYLLSAWIIRLIVRFFRALPLVWKTVLSYILFLAVNLLCLIATANGNPLAFLFISFVDVAIFAVLIMLALQFRRIKNAVHALANGDLSYTIESETLQGDLRDMAESINRVNAGMSKAVDARLRSERFKTELITNVSHDLKTPLTSIVSYVDLLKKTGITDPDACAYIDVLDRQSAKLKKLTEDLVEASKASSGVISVNKTQLNVAELLSQSVAEYTDRFESAQIIPVLSTGDVDRTVVADGRLLWRVFDNLLQNICKYAMPGTRAYIDVVPQGDKTAILFKNISADALNITSEELMERFVRGDQSRHTEGSGLGLSIARSLTELQGGEFKLYLDGDLFKVMITFVAKK